MTTIARPTWEEYAMALAVTAAIRSEDLHHRVGAALLRADHTVAGLGYNGAPAGVEVDWTDREARRPFVSHAESNALRYVHPGEVELLATTMMPCQVCLLLIAAYNIPRVIYLEELDPLVYERSAVLTLAERCDISLVQLQYEL